ncbi:MAG TPA: acyloxyacyl hydrolase [Chthoniobacterales bacterium]|jgi:hypothetical protein
MVFTPVVNLKLRALVFLLCTFLIANAHAQDSKRAVTESSALDARFSRGTWEVEDLVGVFLLFDRGGNDRPVMDIAINSLRVGYMVHDPAFSGMFRGNLELLGELFGGTVFNGPGDVIAGGTLFFRYNFVQPGARIVPYLQTGGGFVYSDFAHGLEGGNAVSLDVNFNLQAIAGVRFNVNPRWSILAEGSYRHISNASLSDPNYGIDQAGGSLGMAFSF